LLDNDAVFKPGRPVILSAAKSPERDTQLEFFRRQHGRCVAKLRGIDTISEAERYVGSEIRILADTLPEVEDGSFYTFQLKGCRVFAEDGEYIGTITDVLGSGGAEILKVDRENEETLIPFAQSYMRKIDLDQRRIEVDLPEGLRDLNKKT
jgi:16S rRNA processing protein RimM